MFCGYLECLNNLSLLAFLCDNENFECSIRKVFNLTVLLKASTAQRLLKAAQEELDEHKHAISDLENLSQERERSLNEQVGLLNVYSSINRNYIFVEFLFSQPVGLCSLPHR